MEEASMGAVQILTHSMVQSIEENSVRKGYDPREFALVVFGGAGPLHGAALAKELLIPTVISPQARVRKATRVAVRIEVPRNAMEIVSLM